jgi:glycosyltransferase involved in cell wall biosynthesis
LHYQNVSINDILDSTERPFFITIFKENYLPVIIRLNDEDYNKNKNILVIHDHRDISDKVVPYIKNKWKLITIRKTVQEYLNTKYNLDSLFLYHPFYPYPVTSSKTQKEKKGAVSISRIAFEKNIDIIIKANNLLRQEDQIKLYGSASRMYVHLFLGGYDGDFNKYYCGIFDKSFSSLSNLLAGVKFVVDLSVLKHDGGGTQYTFLEAIHNDCALILHRKWIENINPKYCDFKEGYNCFLVENEKELADLISEDPDTTKVVQNAKKLIDRHINFKSEWSKLSLISPASQIRI